MRIHVEVAVAPDWRPWVPGGPGMEGGTERLAHRLASLLAARGWHVTARGGGAEGVVDGVRYLLPVEAPGVVDAAVCVMCDPPSDAVAARRIAYSHAAQWPSRGDWDAVVAVSSYHARLLGRNRCAVAGACGGGVLLP